MVWGLAGSSVAFPFFFLIPRGDLFRDTTKILIDHLNIYRAYDILRTCLSTPYRMGLDKGRKRGGAMIISKAEVNISQSFKKENFDDDPA